jgi:hypothetical protein
MPFTQFTTLDFDEIKESIKSYLRANTTFTDFDYEGSNLSVLINILAYNTYLTAYNSNMIANESFLDSATLRENVTSLARNIGYVPKSKRASRSTISFTVSNLPITYRTVTLKAGLVCIGNGIETNLKFSIPENITVPVIANVATFSNITVYEGSLSTQSWVVDTNQKEIKYILENPFTDTSTLRVKVSDTQESSTVNNFNLVDNIIKIDANSKIYLIQEYLDERYQILFGDGIIGKKLENNNYIIATYITTSGTPGNGASNFTFSGVLYSNENESTTITRTISDITTISASSGGSEIESVSSIKYFAPRLYASQYRAVTAKDYETVIPYIYDNVESVSAYGGEELQPPQYGKVFIAIKPKNLNYLSSFSKREILSKLKSYSVAGIVPELIDLKYLFVETNTSVYYNASFIGDIDALKTRVSNSLNAYSQSIDVNKFGGRFKYSNIISLIDQSDSSIVSNITTIKMVRNLRSNRNVYTQYELCFGNAFNVNSNGYNIKTTGFTVSGIDGLLHFGDFPTSATEGRLYIFKTLPNSTVFVVKRNAGSINYSSGEILIDTISISSTEKSENIIEFEISPESNDVIGKQDLYVQYNVQNSKIATILDTITSGASISGSSYVSSSSYPSTTTYTRT